MIECGRCLGLNPADAVSCSVCGSPIVRKAIKKGVSPALAVGLVVFGVGIALAIVAPSYMKGRHSNESMVIGDVRTVISSESGYAASTGTSTTPWSASRRPPDASPDTERADQLISSTRTWRPRSPDTDIDTRSSPGRVTFRRRARRSLRRA